MGRISVDQKGVQIETQFPPNKSLMKKLKKKKSNLTKQNVKTLEEFSTLHTTQEHFVLLNCVLYSTGEWRLSKILPSYRSPAAIKINNMFLLNSENKDIILSNLQVGFLAEQSTRMPRPGKIPKNYFKNQKVIAKCRARFTSEVQKGRMLGGVGQTRKTVEWFLGGRFYTIPCGAVPKNNDPHGRIIHDYSWPSATRDSVNAALRNTSVEYISFVQRARELSKVDYFVKVDLKDGYRQLGVHPSEWYTQVYSLGENEFYIDLTMPFGKANSSKIFCRWTTAQCNAFVHRFQEKYGFPIVLKSYIDDFFGGPIKSNKNSKNNRSKAELLFESLIAVGELTGAKMNLSKCFAPARVMEILGFVYDAIARSCRLSKKKQHKYINRVMAVLQSTEIEFKKLEKLVGNLTYAAQVSPFGRPFLSVLSCALYNLNKRNLIQVSRSMKNALIIWKMILLKNRGLSYDFILGHLPKAKEEQFVDASTNFGCGGLAGTKYFMVKNSQLRHSRFL